jgi:topoisomerase IA-like protein
MSHPFNSTALLLTLALATLLGGCQMMGGGEPAEAIAARKEAEGKAVGGACRHAGRAIEDCFALNKRADKAAMFAGWREMNDYMRENKIDAVLPQGAQVAELTPEKPIENIDKAEKAKKVDAPAADDGSAKKPAKSKKHDS